MLNCFHKLHLLFFSFSVNNYRILYDDITLMIKVQSPLFYTAARGLETRFFVFVYSKLEIFYPSAKISVQNRSKDIPPLCLLNKDA